MTCNVFPTEVWKLGLLLRGKAEHHPRLARRHLHFSGDLIEGHKVVSSAGGSIELESTRWPFCFDPDPHTVTSETDAFPVTIEHAFGSTTIEKEPQRVATLGWSDQDHVAALGVVPVGATKITYGGNRSGSTDFFDATCASQASATARIVRTCRAARGS